MKSVYYERIPYAAVKETSHSPCVISNSAVLTK